MRQVQIWEMEYEENDYIRFGPNNWFQWYSESLETEYYMEKELEEEFQKRLKEMEGNN